MADNLIPRADAVNARTLWFKFDTEGRLESVCSEPLPDHDAYVSVKSLKAIPAVEVPDPAQIRADALREAADAIEWKEFAHWLISEWQLGHVAGQKAARATILALIPTGKEQP